MYDFSSLHCNYCNSVMLNLPKSEIYKLNNLTFRCDCCGNHNFLNGLEFRKVRNTKPLVSTMRNIQSQKVI